MNEQLSAAKLTAKDYTSDQEVRWCPGCGDYAILKAVQRTLPELGGKRENTVFVSGIGCSSRFPYYLSTNGFHTIHGRAPAIASGIKLANPELDVWIVTGDGDGLSIGGNHLLHVLRRNLDMQILLFNNEIYGLTKGQYSPTSRVGTRTPSSPRGSIELPVSPCAFALGAGARFVARGVATQQKELPAVLKRAHAYKGSSFVEIFQNCLIYNDGAFDSFTAKNVAADMQLLVEHGKPLIFGKERNRGLRIKPGLFEIEVVTIGENGVTVDDILIHDETNKTLASMLIELEEPEFPVALGVIYCNPAATYETSVYERLGQTDGRVEPAALDKLLRAGRTWEVTN
ncbi:MAG: 2-oxoacid:ferredoxin oxidoreductase subunit beta [Sphingomonadales bacterium]